MTADDLSGFSLIELFQAELETHAQALDEGLLGMEAKPNDPSDIMALMRAAHSIKGAARIVGIEPIVELAHAMEDCFVAVTAGHLPLDPPRVDVLLEASDLLKTAAKLSSEDATSFLEEKTDAIRDLTERVKHPGPEARAGDSPDRAPRESLAPPPTSAADVRVRATLLSRLLAHAGEGVIEARHVQTAVDRLQGLERQLRQLGVRVDRLYASMRTDSANTHATSQAAELQRSVQHARRSLLGYRDHLESQTHRAADLSERIYREVLRGRMRPFGDATRGLARLVRDVARELGKQAHLEIEGEDVPVDRDVLRRLEAPLGHLVRNAVDHGIERPEARRAAGKPEAGLVKIEAHHHAGMLEVHIRDDGRGVDPAALRALVVERELIDEDLAKELADDELLEFLFLPGFTTTSEVTQLSGRGVGLDVVQQLTQSGGGVARAEATPGQGMHITLVLPVTRSVVRAALVEIGREPYAFPLARIDRLVRVAVDEVSAVEGRQQFLQEGKSIGLVLGADVLNVPAVGHSRASTIDVVVLTTGRRRYGVVVDRFLGEQDLVVRPLDPRLGKVPNIDAASLSADGEPVLLVDVQDLLRTVDKALGEGRMRRIRATAGDRAGRTRRRRRILVVDDSITVREVERNLLQNHGYEVEVAVDGAEAWNVVRGQDFDLVLTDVDMPRMNGIRLVRMIKSDPRLAQLPVMVVSYKEREEDRMRGLEAGADAYVAKSSFHDESLLESVRDLIGGPQKEDEVS